jgi:hypothetical protein
MKRTSIGILGFCLAVILSGCGGENGPQAARNNAASVPSNSVAVSAGSPTTPNSSQPGIIPGNSVAVNTNEAVENPVANARNRKLEAMRQAASDPSVPKTGIETLLKQSTRPAPENSEFSVALTDVVVERRTFLNHPILSRVEKVTDGQRSTIKLLTTDGRTIELPGRAIEKLSIASAASILKAAGLQLPPSQPADRKPGAANRN